METQTAESRVHESKTASFANTNGKDGKQQRCMLTISLDPGVHVNVTRDKDGKVHVNECGETKHTANHSN